MFLACREYTSSRVQFVNDLPEILQNCVEEVTIMIDDMNINLHNKEESADYLNMLMANGFIPIYNQPTRDKNCLDHVLVNSASLPITYKKVEHQITDHSMYITPIEIGEQNTYHEKEKETRIYVKIFNEGLFKTKLQNTITGNGLIEW